MVDVDIVASVGLGWIAVTVIVLVGSTIACARHHGTPGAIGTFARFCLEIRQKFWAVLVYIRSWVVLCLEVQRRNKCVRLCFNGRFTPTLSRLVVLNNIRIANANN